MSILFLDKPFKIGIIFYNNQVDPMKQIIYLMLFFVAISLLGKGTHQIEQNLKKSTVELFQKIDKALPYKVGKIGWLLAISMIDKIDR